jgi:signal transduction histidine kinase
MVNRPKRVVNAKELLAQRNVLIALSSALTSEQSGGVLGVGVDVLMRTLALKGVLAYRFEGDELELVVEQGVPRKAKAWLSRLDTSDEDPWFIAQRVAKRVRADVDGDLAKERAGLSLAPTLREAGWGAVAAAPIAIGRSLKGVLVVAAADVSAFDRETMRVLEAAGGLLALALAREDHAERDGDGLEQTMTVQLATVGLLAAGVAEDLDGPLETMRLQLEFQESLVRSLRERVSEQMHELTELNDITLEILAGVRRIGDIAGRLKMSSADAEEVTLDFAYVIRASVARMQAHLEVHHIALELLGMEDEVPVDGREPELRLLIIQLMLQAIDQCMQAKEEATKIALTLRRDAGRCVLSVDCSGRPPGARKSGAEIFDALFARGQGAQLGRMSMSLAKQTVLAHHGHIEVAPSPLGGTQVSVMLPVSASSIDPDARESLAAPTLRPQESPDPVVLWIDDDDVMVATVRRFLESYEVRTASSVADARMLMSGLSHAPAAVFCVVELAGGPTIELHQDATQAIAERFVFMSGGVIPAKIADYLMMSGCPTLIKPLTLEEVVDVIEGSVDDPGRASAPTLDPQSR